MITAGRLLTGPTPTSVMPGLVPGTHVFDIRHRQVVDGRAEPGHDGKRCDDVVALMDNKDGTTTWEVPGTHAFDIRRRQVVDGRANLRIKSGDGHDGEGTRKDLR